VLEPLLRRVERHVLAAERLHGDDTTVPVLAKGRTITGRCWIYVRDDRPFGGRAPPAAMFYYSRDRGGEHVEAHLARWSGLLQADAYAGYNQLYVAGRAPGPILEAACWAHARRPFFALADIEASARRKAEGKAPAPISPLALEAAGASIGCLRSSAPSMDGLPKSAGLFAKSSPRRSLPRLKPGCGRSGPSSLAAATLPRPWTIC
jgi:hypothetical protein